MNKQEKKSFLNKWHSLKQDIDKFVKDKDIQELKSSVQSLVKSAQKDINTFVDKDVQSIKKKFQSEKKQVEKLVERAVREEIKRAKSFAD